MKTNTSFSNLTQALEAVNTKHGYKLSFDRLETKGKYIFFTLKTASKIPGARVSWSGRNLPKASWHAHGYLFDEIFNLDSTAIIYSGEQKITKMQGNWIDRNIGSHFAPCMYSQTSIL